MLISPLSSYVDSVHVSANNDFLYNTLWRKKEKIGVQEPKIAEERRRRAKIRLARVSSGSCGDAVGGALHQLQRAAAQACPPRLPRSVLPLRHLLLGPPAPPGHPQPRHLGPLRLPQPRPPIGHPPARIQVHMVRLVPPVVACRQPPGPGQDVLQPGPDPEDRSGLGFGPGLSSLRHPSFEASLLSRPCSRDVGNLSRQSVRPQQVRPQSIFSGE
ncbi:unnamed protein product [Nezara viridula]|uniref:Uncharacterized protein n=1 Tax=Nezara viridula TaxID=85310 RepID=A0A9P0MNU6_NEZVI|nr:unnamed protein product [Nezara viridula]